MEINVVFVFHIKAALNQTDLLMQTEKLIMRTEFFRTNTLLALVRH